MSKDNKSEKLDIIAAFVHELMNTRGGESVLYVCISNFCVFSSLSSNFKVISGFDWRSKIADGEKYDEWLKIKSGQAKVVVGARSAIF